MRLSLSSLRSRWVIAYDSRLSRLLAADMDRRREVATRTSPRFAEIERARHNEDGTITFLSSERGLTLREWHEQNAVLDTIPAAWWAPLVAGLSKHPLRQKMRSAKRAVQRAERGWDDSALWNLNTALCATLGSQLAALASASYSWPDQVCRSYEEWQQLLLEKSDHLLAYASSQESDADRRFYDLLEDPDAPETSIHEAMMESQASQDLVTRRAQDALHWVADVLPHLWD